jgi:hypothetical protein
MKALSNRLSLKLNVAPQFRIYAYDVNLLGVKAETKKENTEPLSEASNKVGLQENANEAKCMLLSSHQK